MIARGPLTIVLAEDDAALRTILATAFRRDGHEVIEVADGSALLSELAFQLLYGSPLSPNFLLVADLRMPGTDSLNVMRTLAARGRTPPFILLTAFGEPAIQEEAKRLGAIQVLDKPFDIDALRAVINRAAHPPVRAPGLGRSG